MKVNELKAGTKVPNIVGTIMTLFETKLVTSKDGERKLREGILEDDTGQVKISLWQEQTDSLKEGDVVSFTNAWCKEFEGELQIATGYHGKLHKVPPKKIE